MKIENQNAFEVPIFFKFSINSKKQKTKQKTQETKMKCWLHFPTSFKIVWLSRRKSLSHQYNEYKYVGRGGRP